MRNLIFALFFVLVTAAEAAAPPETIVSIMRPKSGKEAELIQALRTNRKTLERLDAVTGPQVLYRGADEVDGKPIIVEIFTWKSGDIPDNAPPEIVKGWSALQALVETRNGRRGIEFYGLDPVKGEAAIPAVGK